MLVEREALVPCTRMLAMSRSHLRASKLAVVASTLSPSGRNRLSSGTKKL